MPHAVFTDSGSQESIRMDTPIIWLENLPRRLNFLPHVRTLAYSPQFTLTSECCCSSLQFCFRQSTGRSRYLEFTVDGVGYHAGFPHLMVKRPGQRIEFKNATESNTLYFSYLPESISFFDRRGLASDFVLTEIPLPDSFGLALRRITDFRENLGTPGVVDHFDLICYTLVHESLLLSADRQPAFNQNDRKIQKIASYLQVHFMDKTDFGRLAKQFGFSRRSFLRHWERIFEQPPGEYVANLRLLEAKRLLKETSLSIREIAARLGCYDDGYFCRFFAHRTGMTPRRYREKNTSS